jgi:peptide-methionine (S)-S-oxide reductase
MPLFRAAPAMPTPEQVLPGRATPMGGLGPHAVTGRPIQPPFPEGLDQAVFGLGCFWGAERRFWQTDGVWTTAVGYAGGSTPNPTYEETCSGLTGHTEAVLVVFDPAVVSYEELLRVFWEAHDPTQGMRQGNDVGTQYRSAIYWTSEAQRAAAEASRDRYAQALEAAGHRREITTELAPAGPFFYAEGYHQQYLHKNPGGYCGLGGTGVACPTGLQLPEHGRMVPGRCDSEARPGCSAYPGSSTAGRRRPGQPVRSGRRAAAERARTAPSHTPVP